MTTLLDGERTVFLPFNRGDCLGSGNPLNPVGHRSAYLWQSVWQKDAWLDILARFLHVEPAPKGSKKPATMIFPRFHQWDGVRQLEEAARTDGAGHSHLVQHSAGSGKSNTIAWLAHRLSSLHAGDVKVFDKGKRKADSHRPLALILLADLLTDGTSRGVIRRYQPSRRFRERPGSGDY